MSATDSLAGSGRRRTPTVMARIARQATTRQVQLLFAGSVLCAAALLTRRLDHGWFHHDDGSLAHSAERILAGELPHRDFADLYTGLLSFMNAAVFALVGEDLFNLRLPLFVLFLAFAGCFFALARRLVSPLWAFVATLFAIAWSVPVYPAPIASWYLLFLSTFGMYAVVRFYETGRRRWLFAAGACGGISIAVKVVGVWYVAAVVLALLARPLVGKAGTRSPVRSPKHATIVISAALLALGFVIAVMSGGLGAPELVGLLLPLTALCGAVALLGWRALSDPLRGPVPAVLGEVAAFLAGVGVPIALFVAPYAVTGSVGDLLEGVLISPQSRFEFASFSMPHPATLLWGVPVAALFFFRRRVAEGAPRRRVDVAASALIVFFVVTASDEGSYSVIWNTTRALAPFVIVLGALAILRRGEAPAGVQHHVVLLVVLVAGFSTLLQFPFAAPVYFCYVAPLVLLAAIASMRSFGLTDGMLPAVVLMALVVFGIRQLDNQSLASLGIRYQDDPGVVIIDDGRASIRVTPETKKAYDTVRQIVAQHVGKGQTIFAGPDAPEIYFLTKSQNPTPSIIDFLDSSGTTRGERLVRLLREEDVRLVVLNHEPLQSPPLAGVTIERIRSMYRGGERAGHFEVRWVTPRRARTT